MDMVELRLAGNLLIRFSTVHYAKAFYCSEISGGVRNVFVEDCYMDSDRLDTAIRVKNNAMRGGILQDFHVRNVRVGRVAKQVRIY